MRAAPVLLLTLLLVPVGCGPSEECLDRCERFGIDRASARCREICTEDCATLVRTYGMSEAGCRELQTGQRPSRPGE